MLKASETFDVPAAYARGRESVGVLGFALEVLRIQSRALSVAQTYQTLWAASDQQLAGRGLRRSDLPRTAYRMLTAEVGARD